MSVLSKEREAKMRKNFGWHSHGDIGEPCLCNGCLLLREIDDLRAKVRELEEKNPEHEKYCDSFKVREVQLRPGYPAPAELLKSQRW